MTARQIVAATSSISAVRRALSSSLWAIAVGLQAASAKTSPIATRMNVTSRRLQRRGRERQEALIAGSDQEKITPQSETERAIDRHDVSAGAAATDIDPVEHGTIGGGQNKERVARFAEIDPAPCCVEDGRAGDVDDPTVTSPQIRPPHDGLARHVPRCGRIAAKVNDAVVIRERLAEPINGEGFD